MNTATALALKIVGLLGLLLTVLSGVLVFGGVIGTTTHYWLMVLGMVLWFSTAVFWIQSKPLGEE